MLKVVIVVLVILIIVAPFIGNIMSQVERPKYKVLSSSGKFELREYGPMIVAEVQVPGERQEAIRKGFKILADYIFGNNISSRKIEMTAPVTNQLSEKIAMTAPVMQEEQNNLWKVRFVMPAEYSLETLPRPNSNQITLVEVPASRFAVIRFSGLPDNRNLEMHLEELEADIAKNNLTKVGNPIFAFYNPPWTIPLLRRNEVMIQIE